MKRTQALTLGLMAVVAATGLTGCYVEEHRVGYYRPYGYTYSYYYYPDVQVYYYPSQRVYYWRDGSRWRSGRYVPRDITLRSHVMIDLDTREPWRRHDEIIRRYPRDWREDRDRDRDGRPDRS